MRIDGRGADQLREVRVTPNYLRFAEGSCLIEWGKNKVLCAATVEPAVPPWLAGKGGGWVTAEYAMLPRSSKQRVPRDAGRTRPNARAIEIQRLIGRALRAATDMKAFGERMITIDCDVIEADGGTRTASITGGFVAMALAIRNLREAGQIARTATILNNYVAAASVGIVEGRAVLDLNYLEDSQAETDMNVVMTSAGDFIEVQGTAEARPYTRAQLDEMLALAKHGIDQLIAIQRGIVELS
ncbi:ribonuclease PH [Candidatus Poribacteria bacterium]|nr:ribonuclease PH [Candidatus Poribacteria bacterium]